MIASPEDERIFAGVMAAGGGVGHPPAPLPFLVLAVAGRFLGAPYAASSLERTSETLVVNLRAFDCFTLVENVLVLAILARTGPRNFGAFAAALRAARYHGGVVAGYASRRHYFTDWVFTQVRRGLLRDLTPSLGGRPFRKRISYMSDHRGRYPALQDAESFRGLRQAETRISRRLRHGLPRAAVPAAEPGIGGGDVIAVLTDTEGLDCLHAGFAVRRDGRVHLLHASSRAGAVIVSPEPLADYLAADPRRTGILVARPQGEPGEGLPPP
jgi:hypothetical protein